MTLSNNSLSLFSYPEAEEETPYQADPAIQAALGQYPTPYWVAEALIERHFSHLGKDDLVIEPSCGPGSFLAAVPDHVPAIGIELDARTAAIARLNTGRPVIEGDFRSVAIDGEPTAILGNPPFDLDLIDGFLQRAHSLLRDGGQVGLVLPCYAFQTAARVSGYAAQWSLAQEMIPRNIFPGLSKPLLFAMFTKERVRRLVGFFLYDELTDLNKLTKPYREAINGVGRSVWKNVVQKALSALGGKATLAALYAEIEGQRPTNNQWWRAKVRQTLARHSNLFQPEGNGVYRLA